MQIRATAQKASLPDGKEKNGDCLRLGMNSRSYTKSNRKHDVIMALFMTVLFAGLVGAFAVVWSTYYGRQIIYELTLKRSVFVVILYFVISFMFQKIYDATNVSFVSVGRIVYSQFLAIGMSDGLIWFIISIMARHITNPLPGLLCFIVQMVFAAAWSFIVNACYFRMFEAARTAVVYDGPDENVEVLVSRYNLKQKFRIVKVMKVSQCARNPAVLDDISVVFFSNVHSYDRNPLLKICIDKGIRVFAVPGTGDSIMSAARKMNMFHLPMLMVERYRPPVYFVVAKRILDVLLCIVGLVLFAPFMAVLAIMIKSTDHGPVFYKQTRLTKDGREFELIKFRSMREDAEKDGTAVLSKGEKDDRVTPVGRFMRRIRADELPQLFNVLKGEMSFIGPRPERPDLARKYEAEMPEFSLRLQAKAGITGLAQVYGKYNSTPYEKLQFDLMYIANPTLLQEVSIFFATFKVLFMAESTEGIDE